MKARRLLAAALLFLALQGRLAAQTPASPAPPPPPQPAPVNLSFERGEIGQVPDDWTFSRRAVQSGYAAALADDKAQGCDRCVRLSQERPGGNAWSSGDLVQQVDATPWRGKRVRVSAAVRYEGAQNPGYGRVLLRTDRAAGRPGFSDFTTVGQTSGADWRKVELLTDVEPDAIRLSFGAALFGGGRLWVDSFTVAEAGPAGAGLEPPRPLSDRGLDNLAAFTRLLGYVRYFHPSDAAAEAPWERLAVAGVRAVEDARDAPDLARRLEGFFQPLAPTLRVFPTGGKPASAPDFARPAGASAGPPRIVAWKHFGVDTRNSPSYVYWSRRINNQEPAEPRQPSYLYRELDATPLHGKKIRLRALVRMQHDADKGEAPAQMFLGVYGGPSPTHDDGKANPITGGEWHLREMVADVPTGATRVSFGLHLPSGGRLWIDDLDLEVVEEAGGERRGEPQSARLLADTGFEQGAPGSLPEGWKLPGRDSTGYSAAITAEGAGQGRQAVLYAYTPPPPPALPRPEDAFQADLPGGVSMRLPVALYADAQGTLPRAAGKPLPLEEGRLLSGNDRATRLAGVALAWNVFQHFYPYFDDIQTDWPEALRRSLRSAATDADQDAFGITLQRLVADLHDGHGGVYGPGQTAAYRLPLIFDVVEGQLAVTYVDAEKAPGVERGSRVVSVNGRPVREVMDEAFGRISAAGDGWRHYRLSEMIAAGPQDEEVRLELQSPAGAVSTVSLRRILPANAQPRLKEPRPEPLAEIRPGIFYIDVERVTDPALDEAYAKLAAAKGVIVDVRGYPQISTGLLAHLMKAKGTSAQWRVPVVQRPDREGLTFDFSNWDVDPEQPRIEGKVAFLTDGRAISYAETFLGIAEHYKLGEIVGAPTAGTNGNINPFSLPGGYQVMWTGMTVLKHDGSRHHGVGILPTVPVSRTLAAVAAGRDEVLEKAIEVVGGPAS